MALNITVFIDDENEVSGDGWKVNLSYYVFGQPSWAHIFFTFCPSLSGKEVFPM